MSVPGREASAPSPNCFTDILKTLNPKQAEAVKWCDGPQLVLAGAGSGKTRVLTSKIAWLISEKHTPPHRVLALTFTNRAAREMAERVHSLVGADLKGMSVSTFHSFGVRFLYRNTPSLETMGYPRSFVIFDRGDCRNIIKRAARDLGIDTAQTDIGSLTDRISRAKSCCDPISLDPDINERWRTLYDRYQEGLKRSGALDFDDLMILPLHILSTDSQVLERERARLDWVLVDEYQDVNTPQYLLLKLLANSGRLMVVGDPDQSIYGWRGADMSLIMRFEEDFPGAGVFILDQNYRSTSNILNAANSIIQHNRDRRDKNLWTSSERGSAVRVLMALNDREESAFIAGEIERLANDGYGYGEIAILYRMNALSRGYEQELLERGIPYKIVRGVAFYDRREVKDVVSMLRLAYNPRDTASLERIANIPARGLGKKSLSVLSIYLANAAQHEPEYVWREIVSSPPLKGRAGAGVAEMAGIMLRISELASLRDAVNYILYDCGYGEYIEKEFPDEWEERTQNVLELISLAPDEGSVPEALAQIALFTDQESGGSDEPKVNLLTLHAAKGLEFPVVFLVGFEEGIFPSARSLDTSGGLEEERRLCYVGMTRARERLYISGVMSRLIFGAFQRSPFSRFIFELPDGVLVDDRTKKGGKNVRGRADGRRWGW
ncbi:MAG: UvrD-helicase domain-containing protein [Synergistaceae bacterium]|nr:UvrD-helicase domain-containing protein [Synergistaceae bacterium]